ncbi:MAG: hypothetical protein II036_06565, partial [Oscillospiraceae bacterium]|nr:hypothetical protein [Oscillospiraceae bacterium]
KDSSRDRVLNLIRRGEEANISYGVSGSGNFMSYTIDSEFSPGEVIIGPTTDIFGKRSARFEVIDQGAYFYDSAKLSDQVVNLDPEDYEITSVTMNAPTIRVYTQPDIFENAYWTSDEEASRGTPVILFGRTDESAEWVKYATYLGGSITTENEATASGNTVYLPSGVHQVKQQLDTNGHGASINYSVNIKLIPSEHMLNEIIEPAFTRDEDENYIMLQLYNTAESVISDPTGEIEAKVTSGDSAIAYLHGRNYKNSVTLDKQYDRLSNGMYYDDRDVIGRMIKFSNTVTLTLQSNVVSYDDYMDVISDGSISNPRGGTFYDLLPLGVQPDMDSIKVDGGTGNDKVIEKYLIENFRGSGRTMLVVKVSFDDHITYMGMISETQRYSYDYQKYRGYSSNYPTTGYKNVHTLTYTSAMPWIEYQNRKTTVGIPPLVNSVAFESDEASLGNIAGWSGEKDKADYASDGDYANCRTKQELMRYGQDERELMTDLIRIQTPRISFTPEPRLI